MVKTRALQAAAATDPGRERANNEDRVLCEPELGIFAVIDGVGGESAGEVAAETALEVLRARLSRRTTDADRLVREAIALANRQIYERAQANPKLSGMSCVLTVAVLDGARVTVGHVGDSRLYLLLPDGIRKVTSDHSPVGAREDAGELSEMEAMRHPRRNEIFRDVGSSPHEPEEASWIDVLEVPFDSDAALLLCSDGLSDLVPAQEIRDTVESNAAAPSAAVRALIERANAAGGKDNISAVLVVGERYADALRRRRGGAGATSRTARSRPPSAEPAGRGPTRAQRAEPAASATFAAAATSAAGASPGLSAAGASAGLSAAGAAKGLAGESSPTPGGGAVEPRRSPAGAAWARRSLGERIGDALRGPLVWWLLALAVALAALVYFREPLLRAIGGLTGSGGSSAPGAVLVVGTGDGGFASIGEALAAARPGQTVEVAPGRYRERIALRDGVALVSRVPRGAILLPPSSDAGPSPASGDGASGGAADSAPGVLGSGPGNAAGPTAGSGSAAAGAAGVAGGSGGGARQGNGTRGGAGRAAAAAGIAGPSTGGEAAGPAAGLSSAGPASGNAGPAAASSPAGNAGAAGDAAGGPGGAAAQGASDAAVVATGVHGASLVGFRVVGDLRAPWTAGVRLEDSEVTLDDVEVSGVSGAGIDVRGADRSTVRYCYVHHNSGPGLAVAGDAAPRLLSNLIAANGIRPGGPAPGVEVRGGAAPLLADNRIEGNGGPGVTLQSAERVEEILRWNAFGAVPRDQAVRVVAAPAGTGAPAGSGASGPGNGLASRTGAAGRTATDAATASRDAPRPARRRP